MASESLAGTSHDQIRAAAQRAPTCAPSAPQHSRLMYTATYISSPRMYPKPVSQFLLSGRENEIERRRLISGHRFSS